MNKLFMVCLIASSVSGCAVVGGAMDGMDAKTKFSCKAPDGVLCESMTGVIANAEADNLPAQQVNKHSHTEKNQFPARNKPVLVEGGVLPIPQISGAPILRNPKTLRVWVAPWESSDRTLFDQSYFYIVIDDWKWTIEHNKRRIRDAYAPVDAPVGYQQPVTSPKPAPVSGISSALPLPLNNNYQNEIKNLNVDVSQFVNKN